MLLRPLTRTQRAALEKATNEYHEQLLNDEAALSYLTGRGIHLDTIRDFRLGYVGHAVEDGHRRFQGMHSIPNLGGADDEHPVGIKFRDVSPDAPKKYDQPSGQVPRLFNLRALSQAFITVFATEGEYDSIILAQCGLPAIALPGANSWSAERYHYRQRIFEGYHLVVCRDNDKAGLDMVKAMSDLPDMEVRVPPSGSKDVNELWLNLNQDKEALRAWATGRPLPSS